MVNRLRKKAAAPPTTEPAKSNFRSPALILDPIVVDTEDCDALPEVENPLPVLDGVVRVDWVVGVGPAAPPPAAAEGGGFVTRVVVGVGPEAGVKMPFPVKLGST